MAFATIIGALVAVQFLVGTATCSKDTFEFPVPTIVAYKPSGFEVSIPHERGIESVTFHANAGTDPGKNRLGGSINEQLQKKLLRNKWVYTNTDLKLTRGQRLFFWMSIVYKGQKYQKHDNVFVVRQLVKKS